MHAFQIVDTLKTLDEITERDLPVVGGKAYNCARLRQAGFPVPDGIVVSSQAVTADIRALASHPWFQLVPLRTLFAVRSSGIGEDSAGHSFAGIHDTHLNVEREEVAEAVVVCRRSSQSDQARAYRGARHLDEDEASIAVLVQHMVPAVISGVAFTVNPVTGADEIVINAARGLGEALVSGLVTPDEILIRKSDVSVISSIKASGAFEMLDIQALAAILLRIERHYGAPQDIEWCYDGRQFWIVQSRPVTTGRPELGTGNSELRTQNPEPRTLNPEPRTLNPDVEWTRANLAEVLPDQLSPQAIDLYEGLLDSAERTFFGRLMAPESELGPVVKAFHGRLYFNLNQLRHVTMSVGSAFADTLRSLGHAEQIRPEDEIATRPSFGHFVRTLPDLVSIAYRSLTAGRIFRKNQATTDRALARLNAVDPAALSDGEIWATFEWWLGIVPDTMRTVFVMSGVQVHEDVLRKACRRVGFPYDALVYPQLAAGQRSVSAQQAYDLVALADVARHEARAMTYLLAGDGSAASYGDYRAALAGTTFLARFDEFLARYGHRGRYESDWAIPRLHEEPAPALFAIRGHLHAKPQNVTETEERQEAEAAAARRAFDAKLTRWQRWTLGPRVMSTLRRLKQQYVWREQVRSDLTRVLSRIRDFHLALANRFVERGWIDQRDDYFLLHLDEVKRAVSDPDAGADLRRSAARRAARLEAERDLQLPLFMRESELPRLMSRTAPVHSTASGTLTGLCVSPGAVEAEVVVMRDPREFAAMKRGAILVATATDPSWTPLFTLASGVIVEVGGMLSHASTIAREYGLPALANVKDATRVLTTGDRVRLDASGGMVSKV